MNMIDELDEVLGIEEEALLQGDFMALEALVSRKEGLAAWLSTHEPDLHPQVYRDLKERASWNEELLKSAQRGVQAALLQIRHSADNMEQATYSSSGERRPLSRTPSTIMQKL